MESWRALTEEDEDSYDDSGQSTTSEFGCSFSLRLCGFGEREARDEGEEGEKGKRADQCLRLRLRVGHDRLGLAW